MTQPWNCTVAIVTRNRCHLLSDALAALHRQTLPPALVMVIDNNSSDSTPEIARQWASRLPLRYVTCPEIGVNHARNTALDQCTTTMLAFTDDDGVADSRWLESLSKAFRNRPEAVAIQGVKGNYYPQSLAAALIQFASRDLSMMRDRSGEEVLSPTIVDTCSFAFKTDPVRRAGIRFDPSFVKGGDRHFGHQIMHAGLPLYFCESAIVLHRWPRTLSGYFAMRWRAGIAKRRIRSRLGADAFQQQRAAIRSSALLKLAWMHSQPFPPFHRALFVGLVGAGFLTTACGARVESWRSRGESSSAHASSRLHPAQPGGIG